MARPNIGFWQQLIQFESRRKGVASVKMIEISEEGFTALVPDFYKTDVPHLYRREIDKQIGTAKLKQNDPNLKFRSQKQFNEESMQYE